MEQFATGHCLKSNIVMASHHSAASEGNVCTRGLEDLPVRVLAHAERDGTNWMPRQRHRELQRALRGVRYNAAQEIHVHGQKLGKKRVDVAIICHMERWQVARAKLISHCIGELVDANFVTDNPIGRRGTLVYQGAECNLPVIPPCGDVLNLQQAKAERGGVKRGDLKTAGESRRLAEDPMTSLISRIDSKQDTVTSLGRVHRHLQEESGQHVPEK